MIPRGLSKPVILGVYAWAVALVSAGAQSLTLEQAVAEALTKGTEQAIWAANLASSRSVEAAARARAGLTLSANAGYSAAETWNDPEKPTDTTIPHNGTAGLTLATPLTSLTVRATRKMATTPESTEILADEGSANLTQILWNGYPGGGAKATAEKALITLQSAEWNAQASRNRLILSVKQAYFTLLSAQEALGQLSQTQKQRQDSARFVQTKISLGQATALDLKQSVINSRTADLDLEAGRSALETARRRLANLLGRSDTEPLTVTAEPDPTIPAETLEQAVQRALSQRVEPLVAQGSIRAAQIDASVAFGATTPTVSLTGGLAYTKNQTVLNQSSAVTGTIGVTVAGPLVDAGLASAQLAQAEAQKTAAELQYAQVLRSIPVDVAEAWNAWQLAKGRLEVAALTVEVAEGQRAVLKAQFDAGAKTLADLQSSDVTLSTAQLALLKAKITAQLSALTLQNLMGQ